MSQWRRIHVADLKTKPQASAQFTVTVSSIPTGAAVMHHIPASGTTGVVVSVGSAGSHIAVGTPVTIGTIESSSGWVTCGNLVEGISASLVMKPANVTLCDQTEGINKAWSDDWRNLGRDMNHVLNWAHERRKQAG